MQARRGIPYYSGKKKQAKLFERLQNVRYLYMMLWLVRAWPTRLTKKRGWSGYFKYYCIFSAPVFPFLNTKVHQILFVTDRDQFIL